MIKIEIIIIITVFCESCEVKFFIATAAPVRVFPMVYNDKKEKPITSVFVIPMRIRNPSGVVLKREFAIIAAWDEPRLGRKLQRGAAITEPRIGFFNSVFGRVIFCSGIFVLFFIEIIIVDAPNKPVRRGRSGSLSGLRLKRIKPRIPVRMNTKVDLNFCFSNEIKRIEIKIRKYGIKFFIRL